MKRSKQQMNFALSFVRHDFLRDTYFMILSFSPVLTRKVHKQKAPQRTPSQLMFAHVATEVMWMDVGVTDLTHSCQSVFFFQTLKTDTQCCLAFYEQLEFLVIVFCNSFFETKFCLGRGREERTSRESGKSGTTGGVQHGLQVS